MFSEKFLDELPDNIEEAIYKICREFIRINSAIPKNEKNINKSKYLNAYGILLAYLELYDRDHQFQDIDESPSIESIDELFRLYLKMIREKFNINTVKHAREKTLSKLGKIHLFEISDDDYSRIQFLLNELRALVSASDLFDPNHKQRLLKRLEAIQSELHKKVGNLDMLWGLVGEAGVVLGKFGKDSKPIVDRLTEISRIAWRTQSKTEQLPSGSSLPQLEKLDENDEI